MSEIVPRRAQRKPLRLAATCRSANGLRDSGQISDISPHGCCITVRAMLLKVGARIVLRPDGLEGLTGVVRWIRGNQMGVEFDSSLYEPVVDHLCALHEAGESVSVTTP